MQHSIVGPKGRITIPKAIRDRLGLKPGAKVRYAIASDGSVTLTPVDGATRQAAAVTSDPSSPRPPRGP